MDRNARRISNEDAERIKKAAAKDYEKLRESLLSTGNREDNSNFRQNYTTQVKISEPDRIKQVASEILAKLHTSVSSSDERIELPKSTVEVNIVKDDFVDKKLNLLRREKENCTSSVSNERRNLCAGVKSSFTKLSDSDTSDDGVDSSTLMCKIRNTETNRDTCNPSRKEMVVQLEKDVSTIIVDYSNPLPGTSANVDFPSRSVFHTLQKSSSSSSHEILCSEAVECESDPIISRDYCGNSGGQENEAIVVKSKETHSWDNFVSHLVAVKGNSNLRDLFINEDVIIFNNFTDLTMQAQAVFINLLNIEYTWYRESCVVDSMMSHELKAVIDTLIEKQLLIADVGDEEIELLLGLLSVQEQKNVCKMLGMRDDGRKAVITKSLVDFSKQRETLDRVPGQNNKNILKERILEVSGRIIKLNHSPRELFLRTQLLYALPLTKTMTEDGRIPLISIMNDVKEGKLRYPNYTVRPLMKLFQSREAVVRFQQALHLEANIKWRIKSKDFDEATHLHESAIIQFQGELRDEHASEWSAGLPNFLQTFTRGTVLARAVHHSIECLRVKKMYTKMISAYETLLNQDLYLKSFKGMWYDQLAHIYQNLIKDIPKTVFFLTEALADPSLNYMDYVLLSDRASPIVNGKKRKRSQAYEEIKPMLRELKEVQEIIIEARCFDAKIEKEKKFSYIYETMEGVGQILSTPEEVIMLHFKRYGYNHGINSPFAIGPSIFGILFWDVIYDIDVPNVFLCEYQSLPLDLTSGEFYANRESQAKMRVAQIKELWSEQELYNHVRKTWNQGEGKKSVVSWKNFQDLDQFEVMLRCIGRKILAKICEKMAKEFHILQKGFPSMILWNKTTKACKFIHVKDRNTTLTPPQKSWLLFLNVAGSDAFACLVNAVGSKPPKRKPDSADDSIDLDDSMEIDCAY